MSVKPITNPFPPIEFSRAEQVSNKGDTIRNDVGNREQSYTPGGNFNDNFSIALKDLDTSIVTHINKVMNLRVKENGEMTKVPLVYANMERWANVRKNGVMRDKNGSLVLPMIMFRRSGIEFNDLLPSWKQDLTKEYITHMRSSKWSKDNQYTRFGVEQGVKPVMESIVTGPPEYVNLTYDFVVWTSFMEQMNNVTEEFLHQNKTYWGDSTSYRFLCSIQGGLQDASSLSAGQDRIVRTTFSLQLNGYLIPEVITNLVKKQQFNSKKTITAGRVSFSENIESNSPYVQKRTPEVKD